MRITIVREAYPIAAPFGVAAAVCFIFGWPVAGAVCAVVMLSVLCFFRDPRRTPPDDGRLVLAPADGLVVGIGQIDEPEYIGGPATRVSIFMRLWDVHMTYAPVDGAVERVAHRPGRFGNAGFAKASERNEANSVVVQSPAGRLMFRQIAGMIARRIVCRLKPGDEMRRGERIGLIKFGSRVDVYLPPGCEVLVRRGQRVRGVVSAIARLP
jgi:phosphatidylserine decarboxylase